MRIGFLNNQIDNRGTGNAVFDYAHYNEEILGNKSLILTFRNAQQDPYAIRRYLARFDVIFSQDIIPELELDALYHIKSGFDDGYRAPNSIPYCVHSVFDNSPHGDKYATISDWLGKTYSLPFVPHIVNNFPSDFDLRRDIGIPTDAVVFGRHGGEDTFDIDWAWSAVNRALKNPDIWFLFMNTNKPDIDFIDPPRVVFVDPTANPLQKSAFINSCDAMVHARSRGETFGIAVGEFAIKGKPVVTYRLSREQAHIAELGEYGLYYHDEDSLYEQLVGFDRTKYTPALYTEFTPEKVMRKFAEVFLEWS